jgi:ribosomal protein L24
MSRLQTPIRKNDTVIVTVGKDHGKRGRVLRVLPEKNRLIVEGVNIIKRHTRPNPQRNIKGGIVEREVGFELALLPSLRLSLRNPDFTTADTLARTISGRLGGPFARPLDQATVTVDIPAHRRQDLVTLMTEIEQLRVDTDSVARVVIDEKSGIIVMGVNVRIDTVAIAQGNLTIRVTETPQVSQPGPFAPGPAAVPGVPGIAGQPAATGTVQVPRLRADGTPQRDAAGNDVGIFSIDAARGTLKVAAAGALNYEAQPQYTVVVRARDAAGLFADQTVTVQVIDVNEAVVLALLDAA